MRYNNDNACGLFSLFLREFWDKEVCLVAKTMLLTRPSVHYSREKLPRPENETITKFILAPRQNLYETRQSIFISQAFVLGVILL
jgi:hypothetical protein